MMAHRRIFACVSLATLLGIAAAIEISSFCSEAAPGLEQGWLHPPQDARIRAYWWWINGNVTREAITRDLEEMKAKGFGGALICDADGSSQDGNDRAPHGPTFMTPEWRELYKHTLREAQRLGLEMSLNIQSGWNLGGPMVQPEDAPRKLVWTECLVKEGEEGIRLAQPKARDGFYRDLFVLAFPVRSEKPLPPLKNQQQKALLTTLKPFSAPDSSPLFEEIEADAAGCDTRSPEVLDLSSSLKPDGSLSWSPGPGKWRVQRIGYTLNDHCRVSTCSQGWEGYAIDPFDAGAFTRYWQAVVEPLIQDAGPLAGSTLKYLHTDSWEVEVANWTPTLREEFKKRRGYDPLPWLPVITGKIVNSRDESNRFLHDFRRTIGDLAIDNHYKPFREGARRHGLLIHPESGGPHAVPIDAQQCLGFNDAPMSEFWAWSWRHRVGDQNRFFVKQPASAAHTYGRKLVLAEGFTTIGPHWQETLWDNLKPSFDFACTEGLNLLVWHAFVCSPASEGIPGQQYFAGTHLNPLVTWWAKSGPFFEYINRAQWMLQQGLFVADVAFYYGDHVPNFARLRSSDPARVGAGYDYDVLTAEAVIERASVKEGRITLPDGMSYRVLALPDRKTISLPVLRKIKALAEAGATIVGPRPESAVSLQGYPECDAEVREIAEAVWGTGTASNRVGRGMTLPGMTAREALIECGVPPDFECVSTPPVPVHYIHRRTADADIYFVANRSNMTAEVQCSFRVRGKTPEFWDPVTGARTVAGAWRESGPHTTLPLRLHPYGSVFVVFTDTPRPAPQASGNTPGFRILSNVEGPWSVSFDPKWGGPAQVEFSALTDWTAHPDPAIKYYSGTATYRKTVQAQAGQLSQAIWLDLGAVRELAEVRVNGVSCGIAWTPPFRLDVSKALRAGANEIEIDVVNFWPNRIIGDAALPEEKRLTKTNIRKLTAGTKLMESGLMGPVRLLVRE